MGKENLANPISEIKMESVELSWTTAGQPALN